MSPELKEPVLILGIGGAGSRLAAGARGLLADSDCIMVSADEKDLIQDEKCIRIDTQGIINPSSRTIRGFSSKVMGKIREEICRSGSVIVMANLAGKTGSAVAPLVTRVCKEEGRNPISVTIMPFGFENNRIFDAGVALKRIKSDSACTVIVDNDAMIKSNPGLTVDQCNNITNGAALHIIDSLGAGRVHGGTQVLSASKQRRDVEASVRDALRMLYENVGPDNVSESMIYVVGDNVPVGVLDSVARMSQCAVGSPASKAAETETHSIVMLSSVMGQTKFDKYDALDAIPAEDTLDWDMPDYDYNWYAGDGMAGSTIFQMED